MTGVFPGANELDPPQAELTLVRCLNCNLVQLDQNFSPEILYGPSYGYKSSLNPTMLNHLQQKARRIAEKYGFEKCHVMDIGSNDGSSISVYDSLGYRTFAVDPIIDNFSHNYSPRTQMINDFFSSKTYSALNHKMDIISSIAMFYDLENPHDFVSTIRKALNKNGIWHFEQSYLPSMLNSNSFDTICHEHLEYYSLKVISNLLRQHGLTIIDIEFNSINGGSLAVTAAREDSSFPKSHLVDWALMNEEMIGLDQAEIYSRFEMNVVNLRRSLKDLIEGIKISGKSIAGLGASTKGNVLLQYCGLKNIDIQHIGDINHDKYARVTPGSRIPIIPEKDVLSLKHDYLLVLPWHFRDYILNKISESPSRNSKVILPLPHIEIRN